MEYIYDKLLVVDGIKSVERTGNTIKLLINGSKVDYYRQFFQSYIVIKYLYLDYEPTIPLIFYHCFISITSAEKSEKGFFVQFSFNQATPERSLKIRKIKSKMK